MTIKKFEELLNELAFTKSDIEKFDNLEKITNSKILLKKMTNEIEEVKNFLKEIKWEEINFKRIEYYDKTKNSYRIKWNSKINGYLIRLDDLHTKISEVDDDVYRKLKIETQRLIIDYLEVDIENNNFNSVHFPIDMPDYYKNIGLGIKIFRKMIEKFGYISSLLTGPTQASFEAKLVFHHFFTLSDEVYSVTKNNSGILLISKSLDIQKVKDLVEKYLENSDDYAIDKDLKNNNLFRKFI